MASLRKLLQEPELSTITFRLVLGWLYSCSSLAKPWRACFLRIAISWWVNAMNGKTLGSLNHRWEVSLHVFKISRQPKLFGWVAVASIVFALFSGIETLLQSAISSTTALSNYAANMTTELASALPDGFSGVWASNSHDMASLTYLSPPFSQIIQDFTTKTPMRLNVKGCGATSNISCSTVVTGVGFHYACQSYRSELAPLMTDMPDGHVYEPSNTFFSVNFESDSLNFWRIYMNMTWKDRPETTGPVMTNQNCTLRPAIVEYPVNVTGGVVTLSPPASTLTWNYNNADIKDSEVAVDKAFEELPPPVADKNNSAMGLLIRSGSHSTLGGIAYVLKKLYTTSINMTQDITTSADTTIDGLFAWSFARFEKGLGVDAYGNNTFESPMLQLVANIREIMFRSSLAIAQRRLGNWTMPESGLCGSFCDMQMSSDAPTQITTHPGMISMYHTVYRTNRKILGIAIGLMSLVVLMIFPLYWHYWKLGRKVSMSPLEIAKALQNAPPRGGGAAAEMGSVFDAVGVDRQPQDGSNLDERELEALIGHRKVKYGEIAPGLLGFGRFDSTENPRRGQLYR